jgi:lactate permease
VLALIQVSPILAVLGLLLVFRRPPVQAALVGVLLTVLLWFLGYSASGTSGTAEAAGLDTAVLFASTAFVIAPGLVFVILIERLGINARVANWVRDLGWSKAQQVTFIVLGLAPLLESMTGFGVSLIATVPLLLSLFPRPAALRLSLAGMAVMPWGTLGLATVIGGTLAHLDPRVLGSASALVSAPVFLALGLVALILAGARGTRALGLLAGVWALFVAVLFGLSRTIGPEVAGVGAGAVTLGAGVLLARAGGASVQWPRAAWPYLALFTAILCLKLASLATGLDQALILRGASITWKPLASPGLALILVLILMLARSETRAFARELSPAWGKRAWKPLATIFFFLLMSQALLKGGFFVNLQSLLAALERSMLAPLVAGLAGLGGYLTGSNVGGNAIFMPSVAALATNGQPWLAAMQNSGAGHGALGSLSIIALVLGLARSGKDEEQALVRFGFALVCLNTALVALSGMVLLLLFP